MQHVIVEFPAGPEMKRSPIYDQPMLIENPGAVIVATTSDDRLGMVLNRRNVCDRPELDPCDLANYVGRVDENKKWPDVLENAGAEQWEIPAGIGPNKLSPEEFRDILCERDLVKHIAKLESVEEVGFELANVRVVGQVNFNPTFFLHPQWIVCADIVAQGKQCPEDYESLGKVRLFNKREVRAMAGTKRFQDGKTLSALALAGLYF